MSVGDRTRESTTANQCDYATRDSISVRGNEDEVVPHLMVKHALHVISVAMHLLKEADGSTPKTLLKEQTLSFPF